MNKAPAKQVFSFEVIRLQCAFSRFRITIFRTLMLFTPRSVAICSGLQKFPPGTYCSA